MAEDYEQAEPGEVTNVVVRQMLRRRRRLRLPIIVGSLLLVGFIGFMAYSFGPKDGLKVDGPVYQSGPVPSVANETPTPARDAPNSPEAAGPPARVRIIVSTPGARLWVDNKPTPLTPDLQLSLSPGKHVLRVDEGKRTAIQKLFLEPNDSYRVEFGEKIVVTR